MMSLLLALLGWCTAAAVLTVVLSRVLRVRDRRDQRGSLGAPHRAPGREHADDGIVVDLTALSAAPRDRGASPDGGPADLPRAG